MDDGRPVREGEPGELWLAGDQVVSGYWNNPTATAAAFVSTFSANGEQETWYRTGDLMTHRSDVGLTFRGRIDRQVKLRGLRIELQEIESVLREVTGCALVAVIPVHGSGGLCEKIIAYCDNIQDEAAVKALCLRRLPSYMVPERIYELSTFPSVLMERSTTESWSRASRCRLPCHGTGQSTSLHGRRGRARRLRRLGKRSAEAPRLATHRATRPLPGRGCIG